MCKGGGRSYNPAPMPQEKTNPYSLSALEAEMRKERVFEPKPNPYTLEEIQKLDEQAEETWALRKKLARLLGIPSFLVGMASLMDGKMEPTERIVTVTSLAMTGLIYGVATNKKLDEFSRKADQEMENHMQRRLEMTVS